MTISVIKAILGGEIDRTPVLNFVVLGFVAIVICLSVVIANKRAEMKKAAVKS